MTDQQSIERSFEDLLSLSYPLLEEYFKTCADQEIAALQRLLDIRFFRTDLPLANRRNVIDACYLHKIACEELSDAMTRRICAQFALTQIAGAFLGELNHDR